MCGIAGILVSGLPVSVSPSASRGGQAPFLQLEESTGALAPMAREMAVALQHRGPDGWDVWAPPSSPCALAHARLKVIDLDTGDQPMSNEDGAVLVVFNGEIYNFHELRRELEKAGHRFRSRSDTEVLAHGYEEWGEDLPKRLEGMFAFGIWDRSRQRLFLARDRAGKKPLFVYEDQGRVAFASELKALLSLPGLDDTLDPTALPRYLAYGYVPTPGTFYRRIRKLPPASWLSVTADGSLREGRYWRLDFSPRPVSETRAVQELRNLMAGAVKKRLISDVPLGAFLSGGVDSTIVVGLMSRFMNEPVRTFSIGMADDPNYDETSFAELAARSFGTDHTVFTVEARQMDLLEELLTAYDEPFGDSSALPTYIVSRLTRKEVTVALSGDGGDELFAGYARFLGMVISGGLPPWVVATGDALGRRLPHHPDFRSLPRRFQRFFAAAAQPEAERMLRWIGFFPHRLDSLLKPELAHLLNREELTASFQEPLARNAHISPLARTLALNFETYLLDDLLVKADRCSMAHGLELRSPFLDTALMEFAAGLPDRLLIRGKTFKYILKEAFRDLLPRQIRGRKKMGFGIPLPTWFRTHWRPLVEDRILGADSALWTWLEPEPVGAIVKEHMAGTADHGHQIWALLTLEGWLRRGRFSLPS